MTSDHLQRWHCSPRGTNCSPQLGDDRLQAIVAYLQLGMGDDNRAEAHCASSLVTHSGSPITRMASPIPCNARVAHRSSRVGHGSFATVTRATEMAHDNSAMADRSPGLIHENPATLDHMVEFPDFKRSLTHFADSFAHAAGTSGYCSASQVTVR